MADSNLTVFSKVEDQVFAFTSDRFLDKTDMIGKQIMLAAESVASTFFNLMAQRGKFIDTDNGDGVAYPKISESLWDRKAKAGLVDGSYGTQNRFYFFTGSLERALLAAGSRDVAAILGKPKFKGLRSEKLSNNRTVFRQGRGAVVNGEKVGGRFGRIADLSSTIEIDIFSKVENAEGAAQAIRGAKGRGSTRRWANRLGMLDAGYKKIPSRPLIARYYQWFMDVEVPKNFLNNLENRKWGTFGE